MLERSLYDDCLCADFGGDDFSGIDTLGTDAVFETTLGSGAGHRFKLPGSYPVFTVLMVIYHYVEKILENSRYPQFLYNIYYNGKYYPGEPVNIHIQSLIDINQEKNRAITTKKG